MKKLVVFATACVLTFAAQGAQKAMVKATQAIVFADERMTSPIGYLSSGREIRVGNTPRNNGKVLPVLLVGRIGFIQVGDIELNVDNVTISKRMEAFSRKEKIKNLLTFSLGSSGLGDDWENLSNNIEHQEASAALGQRLGVEIHPPKTKLFAGIGLNYAGKTMDQLAIKYFSFDSLLYWSCFKYKYFMLDIFAGFEFSPQVKIEVRNSVEQNKAVAYGYVVGGQIQLPNIWQFGLFVGISHRSLAVDGIEEGVKAASGTQRYPFEQISGSSIYLGMSYQL